MKILLSVKPVFVEEIMRGKKLFEYRKTIYKNRNISRIVVYSSSPVCRVVGEFDVKDVLCDTPRKALAPDGTTIGHLERLLRQIF